MTPQPPARSRPDAGLAARVSSVRLQQTTLWALAAALLVLGAWQWHQLNSYARVEASSAPTTMVVTGVDPVRVDVPQRPGTVVTGAPASLERGQVIAVLEDYTNPGRVYFASESTGFWSAAQGALWLLVCGTAAWALLAASLVRLPPRRMLSAALRHLPEARPGRVAWVETVTQPTAPGDRPAPISRLQRLWFRDPRDGQLHTWRQHHLRVGVVFDDGSSEVVAVSGSTVPGVTLAVDVIAGLPGAALSSATEAWWPTATGAADAGIPNSGSAAVDGGRHRA